MQREHLAELAQTLGTRFSREELRTLCFNLGLDYDNLPAEGKANKARELVRHFELRDDILNLVEAGKQLRPDIAWDDFIKALPPESETQPAHLFICYKRDVEPDHRLATYLHELLTAQGHTAFIDESMRSGVAWLQEIDRQIEASDFLIVLLSKASADSEMVQAEVIRAYEYRRLQGKPRTLPVRMAYEGLLPYSIAAFLNPLQYVVWESEADDRRVADDILAAIKDRLPDRTPIETTASDEVLTVSEDGRPIPDDGALHHRR